MQVVEQVVWVRVKQSEAVEFFFKKEVDWLVPRKRNGTLAWGKGGRG